MRHAGKRCPGEKPARLPHTQTTAHAGTMLAAAPALHRSKANSPQRAQSPPRWSAPISKPFDPAKDSQRVTSAHPVSLDLRRSRSPKFFLKRTVSRIEQASSPAHEMLDSHRESGAPSRLPAVSDAPD